MTVSVMLHRATRHALTVTGVGFPVPIPSLSQCLSRKCGRIGNQQALADSAFRISN